MKKIINVRVQKSKHPFGTFVLIKQISKTYFTQEFRFFFI